MATWHQMQARKHGCKLYHTTRWTILIDPPGAPSYSYMFRTKAEALASSHYDQKHAVLLAPEYEGREQFASITVRGPKSKARESVWRPAIARVLDAYAGWLAVNPCRADCVVRVRWTGGYWYVVAGFCDTFTGGFVGVKSEIIG